MRRYFRFLGIGLVLGLFTEVQLKLIAGINPRGFLIAVFVYPFLVTASYFGSNVLDRRASSIWKADIYHYLAAGFFGLGFEWFILGNGPGSNANQVGMFACGRHSVSDHAS